jgi:hypothetical protein
MIDRSISRQYRWKVKSRLAVLEYAGVHGVKPAAECYTPCTDSTSSRRREARARERPLEPRRREPSTLARSDVIGSPDFAETLPKVWTAMQINRRNVRQSRPAI